MKKTLSFVLALVMLTPLAACGQKEEPVPAPTAELARTEAPAAEPAEEAGEPEDGMQAILDEIIADYALVGQTLSESAQAVNDKIGDTYEGYIAGASEIRDLFAQIIEQTRALYTRTMASTIKFYRLVEEQIDHEDSDALMDVLDGYYDTVYDDAMDDCYDAVYDDLLDDIYDDYYDGNLDDQPEGVEFGDWLDVRSAFYSDWLDARSEVYSDWLDVRSELYGAWLDVRGEVWEEFEIDPILADLEEDWADMWSPAEEADGSEETEEPEAAADEEPTSEETAVPEPTETPEETADDVIDPEFKETMDSYEAFFDSYIEFMKSYEKSDNALGMLAEYTDFMNKYVDAMQALEDMDTEEMTSAELAYYTEVMGRISQKLIGASL